jgi:hypothetical protein
MRASFWLEGDVDAFILEQIALSSTPIEPAERGSTAELPECSELAYP